MARAAAPVSALSALALLIAAPSIVLAQADAPAPAPDTAQATAPSAPAPAGEKLPAGAPSDDYGFMGWCYGALSGHVDLYDKVLPEVKRIETAFPAPGETTDKVMAGYADQHNRGKLLLARYGKALDAEEASGKTGGVSRQDAIDKGREIWTGSDTADPRTLAQLWMSWGLPGRCDVLSRRITAAKAKH
jgi:hypothetical protein